MTKQRGLVVKPSPIHGRGLFTTTAITKDSFLGTYEGRSTTEDAPHVLWYIDDDDQERGLHGENDLRFVNHSEEPNAGFWGPDLYTVRDVNPGEEITVDYSGE